MERRLFIARRLVENGLVPQPTVEAALRHLSPGADLLEALFKRGLISQDQLLGVRREAEERFSDSTVLDAQGASIQPVSSEILEERQRLRELSERVFVHSPHFSPLFDAIYERLGRLGAGGMGEVFRVRDRRLGREVAIKVLRAAPGDLDAIQRFLREIHLTARLIHPGIPPVYEAGRTPGGDRYFAMRIIEGETLKQRISHYHAAGRPREGLRSLLEVLLKTGETLAYAHSRGVVHRDVKPSNIMIGRFGEVMLLDWGVAKDLNESAPEAGPEVRLKGEATERLLQHDLTEVGAAIGTPGYMAPEQVSARDVDERADVFALGAILCDILTGEPPYRPGRIKVALAAMLARPLESLRQRVADIPPELEALALHALALSYELRIQTAELFVEDLRAYLAKEPVSVYRYGVGARVVRWLSRHPTAMVGGIAATLLLGTVSTYAVRLSLAEKLAAERAGSAAFVEAIRQSQREYDRSAIIASLDAAVAAASRRADACLVAGQICQEQRFFDDAERYYRSAYDAEKPGYEALFALHNLEYSRRSRRTSKPNGKTEFLELILKTARERGEDNHFAAHARAARAEREGDLQAAAREYRAASKGDRQQYWPLIGRARVCYQLGLMGEARAAAEQALKINSRAANAYITLGVLAIHEDKLDEAILLLDRGLVVEPRNVAGLYNRGVARAGRGEHLEAHRDYSAAVEIDPRSIEALLGKLQAAARLRLWDSMPADLERADDLVKSPSQRAALSYFRAQYYRGKGQQQRRIEALRRSLKADPRYPPAAVDYASVLLLARRAGEALPFLDAVLADNPKSAPALDIRSQVHRSLGDLKRAEEDITRAIALEPKNAKLYFSRADLRFLGGRAAEARADLDRAEAADPEIGDPHVIRAFLAEREGDVRSAVAEYQTAARLGLRYLPGAVVEQALRRLGARR